jgi:hypothetical protein
MKRIRIPESKALKALHDIRRQIQREAEKVGWGKYLMDLNKRPSLLMGRRRRSAAGVRERPAKYGK